MTKFYVRIDSYWQNSSDTWVGPYESEEEAESSMDSESGPVRADLGYSAKNVRYQTRCNGIYSSTTSRELGRRLENTLPVCRIPGDTSNLAKIQEYYWRDYYWHT